MENLNGGLGFAATLDIDQFDVSAQAMEQSIRNSINGATDEVGRLESRIMDMARTGAGYITSYLTAQGMYGLMQSVIATRGQFQQLEMAFETMLGSGTKAHALMAQMTETAAKTPFDLAGVAGGAKQLLAYGESADKVNDTLVRLGNIASGLSIPLNDIVYLYGTTMVQGRLYAQDVRQFTGRGIPLVRELADMYGVSAEEINAMVSAGKIGFPEVEKVLLKLTNQGGQFYNLMEKQSSSLTGMIANLGDAWDMALNDIGTANQDIFAAGISGATTLVEHMDDILRIVKSVAVAYGTYRAAVVLNTLATKGYTGVALIDNTVRKAKIALLTAEATLTGQTKAKMEAMTAAQEAHTASLQKQLTAEELSNVQKKLRIAAIASLLTAQQQEYLSNLNLTTSSANYEAVATSVLTAEQKEALSKVDLTEKSVAYRVALEQEVAAKRQSQTITLDAMRTEVKAAAQTVNRANAKVVAKRAALQAAKQELQASYQVAGAEAYQTATKKVAAAQEELNIAVKEKYAAKTDFLAKKKALETAAIKQSTAASVTDTTAKTTQSAATSILTTVTNKCTAAFKYLWATMKANPIGWIITIVGLAYSAFSMFKSETDDTEDSLSALEKATKSATEKFNEQAGKVDALRKVINDGNASYDERNKKLKELKQIIPDYNAELTKEGNIIKDNTEAIEKYLVQLEKQIKMKAAQDELEAAYKKKRDLEKTRDTQSNEYWNIRQTNTSQGYDRNGLVAKTMRAFGWESETNAKNALDETEGKIQDINAQIADLTNEINTTSSALKQSTTTTKDYSTQLSEAQRTVSTLKQEIADLRSGKTPNEDIAKAIEEKTKELKDAEDKVSTLTGKKTKTSGSKSDPDDDYSKKQLEADRKLEEARIAVMEEGYAKRKATLDLQHKQNLAQIDKEESELEKARKKAGKGGLTQDEKAGFNERRELENQSYTKEESTLFDGEIEYKKKQYELYFRWVRNMGQDVADAHFATLLQEGNSYKQYVEQQIQKLQEKQANGTLTEGESNQLITLNMQYNEITGAKSAMDAFKESVTRTINQAQTLAERLEAVAEARAKISNGTSGLVGDDEKAEASLFLSEEEEKNQQELQDRVLTQYRTFEEQKKSIQEEYALLRKTAQEMNDQERLNQINKAEAAELSALNATFLKQSASWSKLFQDMDSLSVAEIEKLINDIESQLGSADLKLNPVDYKAMIDSLNQAKEALISKNPFKALGTFYDNYIAAKKELAEAKGNLTKGTGSQDDVDNAEKDVKSAAKGITKSIEEITSLATECGSSIASMFEALGNDSLAESLGSAVEIMGQLGNAGASVGKIMSGDVVGGITGLVSAGTALVGIFAGLHDKKYEKRIQQLQKEIDALEQSYSRLERAYNNTYWVFNDSEKAAYEQNIDLIEQQISALQTEATYSKKMWNFSKYAQLTAQIKELEKSLESAKEGGDMLSIYEAQKENLKQQQEDLQAQIEAEKSKKKSDSSKIADYEEQIEDITQQIEDLDQAMMETLAGTDVQTAIDEFADALVDAYLQGEDAAEALGKKTKEVLKNAVVEALKRNYLAKGIDEAVKYLGSDEVWADNMLDEDEQKKFEQLVNAAGDNFTKYLSALDGFVEDTEDAEDPLTGAVTSMSEETGGVIAGRLNAAIINQSEQTQIIRQALIYQKEIAENTRYCIMLESILATLKRMETSGNSLLSQGVA